MGVIISNANSTVKALQRLAEYCLADDTKPVIDDVWLELSIESIILKRDVKTNKITHESILTKVFGQISGLSEIITG